MPAVLETADHVWTATDLVRRFGAIPLNRIRTNPPPGTATEQDALDIHDRESRLCELIDHTLVEKTMGSYESFVAGVFFRLLANYVAEKRLGIALPSDGMMRLSPGLVRIPDAAFISWDRLPGRKLPEDDVWSVVPDLAIEVISRGNTVEEMDAKLHDYFDSGVRQVWYVYPRTREVRVYRGAGQFITIAENQAIDGGDVLPGFQLPLSDIFAQG